MNLFCIWKYLFTASTILHAMMTQLQSDAAATAAKSLQSCPTPCDPTDSSPPGSSIHEIFQARVLEWGAIA